MSYTVYKLLHLTGVFLVLLSFATTLALPLESSWRKRLTILNGIGLVVVFVAGFGLLARLGASWEGWVFLKIFIWVFFGVALSLVKRYQTKAALFWWIGLAAAVFAAYLANLKPF